MLATSTIDLAMVELQSAAQDGRVSVHLNPKDFAAFFMLAKVQFRAIRAWQILRAVAIWRAMSPKTGEREWRPPL
jgi:hypothetical protein